MDLAKKHYLPSGASQGLVQLALLPFLAKFTCNGASGYVLHMYIISSFVFLLNQFDQELYIVPGLMYIPRVLIETESHDKKVMVSFSSF